jgi:hypothetical protein
MDARRTEEVPVRPGAVGPDERRAFFTRGKSRPGAVAWFGIRSFYGHLWHLVASAIATQDIDSRDWMHADAPASLTKAIARTIEPSASDAESITAALGRDLFIDYVADTGDDVEVSRAVADLLVREYQVPELEGDREVTLPRGDILLFGGDTAYPVATSTEIEARLLVPWNSIFEAHDDGKKRALLGIPGNHDWFDGLDGFARLFRARSGPLEADSGATAPGAERPVRHFVSWMEAFAMGRHLVKRRALPLVGYEPVQRASYFALSLAPGIDLWGVDRQLRQVNFAQRRFFWDRRNAEPSRAILLCLPDPLRAYFELNPSGMAMLRAVNLDPERDAILCLAGDTHHYERWQMGDSIHLVAGGGGAFLHCAPMSRGKRRRLPLVEFPGPVASRSLLHAVPWRVASGGAGTIPHLALAILFAPIALGVGLEASHLSMDAFSVGTAVLGAVVCSLLGGWRKRTFRAVAMLALLVGVLLGMLPVLAHAAFDLSMSWAAAKPSPRAAALVVYGLAIFVGAWIFGAYLAALARFGLNNEQAFAALGHPGYKHFVRLRVRSDGSAIDAWVIGLVDPLGDPTPKLVDRVRFQPKARALRNRPSPP